MQTLSQPAPRNNGGYALLITLLFLFVSLIVFASMMFWISSNSKVTSRNNQFNLSEAAAEAAAEKVLSQMNYDFIAQSISNSGTYYGSTFIPDQTNDQASWPVKYVFSDTNGVQDQISVNIGPWTTNTVPLLSQYVGLYGEVQPCTITATATPIGQPYIVPATISEGIQFACIPLFQFAIFYNMDLEIDPGAGMLIQGPVWSNGGIWSGTPNVSYNSSVAAVGQIYLAPTASDPFCPGKNDSGTPIGNFAMAPNAGNARITMPIGTNNDPAAVAALIDLPPAAYPMNSNAAYSTNGQIYFANGADLYLTNFPNGTNWGTLPPKGTNLVLFYQDGINSPHQTQLPYDFYFITNRTLGTLFPTNVVWPSTSTNLNNATNIWYAGYSFVTNVSFSDWREGWNGGLGPAKKVQAVQIDLQKYNIWLTNNTATNNGGQTYNNQCKLNTHKSHPIDSIYIYNAVPLTGTTLPAVRVYNGGMLPPQTAPYGFTVATKMPMYVYGHYNVSNNIGSSLGQNSTTYTWPAGLMADSITVLSCNWQDSNPGKLPTPTTTTVNAAMLEGIVPSTNGIYSGGVENFLRLLENWPNNLPLWYNGSIVVMFPSQIATNYQRQTGNYYNAPKRNWSFDLNFRQQAGLPPLTPQSKGVIRAAWSRQ